MSSHDIEKASTTPGLPLSLGMGPLIERPTSSAIRAPWTGGPC